MKRKVTMAELRQIQLDILDKIHEFCAERGLRYSLGGGTLLGAVRHKGFIPWDDDIDIMLPRPDYDRFLNEFVGVCPHYVVQHYRNDDYAFPFAKVYDDRTILIEHCITTGVFIDVFPVDGLPDESSINSYIKRMDKLARSVYHNTRSATMYSSFLRRWIKRLLFHSRTKSIERLEAHLHSYDFDSSSYAGAIIGKYHEKEYMQIKAFKKYIDVVFEGKTYKAIADYDLYLSKHYGNYMELPPKEKQVGDHCFEAWWK